MADAEDCRRYVRSRHEYHHGNCNGQETFGSPTIMVCISIVASYWTGQACGMYGPDGKPVGGCWHGGRNYGDAIDRRVRPLHGLLWPHRRQRGGIVEMSESPPASARLRMSSMLSDHDKGRHKGCRWLCVAGKFSIFLPLQTKSRLSKTAAAPLARSILANQRSLSPGSLSNACLSLQ